LGGDGFKKNVGQIFKPFQWFGVLGGNIHYQDKTP
jgi:hypothetical protein